MNLYISKSWVYGTIFLSPVIAKYMEENLNITNSSFSKQILSVPCRAVIKGRGPGAGISHVAPGYFH